MPTISAIGTNASVISGGGISSRSYWTNSSLFEEFWDLSKTAGGVCVGNIRHDNLTITGSGLNAIYAVPDAPPYIADDTDYVFHKSYGSVSTACDGNRLIGYDFSRVIVKYLDVAPYTIQWIGILKLASSPSTDEMNKMRDSFHLSIWWNNTLSFHGDIKGNKPLAQKYSWTPEVVNPILPADLALTLISGGVQIDWTANALDQVEIFARNDSDAYGASPLYTINAGTYTKNDNAVTPVDMRHYKIRSLYGGIYSAFTSEVSIAMLGAELVTYGDFSDASKWTYGAGWTITGGKANLLTGAFDNMGQNANMGPMTAGSKYRVNFEISNCATTGRILINNSNGSVKFNEWPDQRVFANGIHSEINTAAATVMNTIGLEGRQYGGYSSYSVDNLSIKKVLMP